MSVSDDDVIVKSKRPDDYCMKTAHTSLLDLQGDEESVSKTISQIHLI